MPRLVRETLEMVRRNVEMEVQLIDDLLDVTRIARGKVELTLATVELSTIINRAVEVCKPDIEARRLDFGMDIGAGRALLGRGRRAPAPAGLLESLEECDQVHAVRWARGRPLPAGRGARAGRGAGQRHRHRAGGAAADLRRLRAGERSITRQFGGLGLGLAISKALVEMHGGTIEVHSEGRDKGTTFRIRLPLARARRQPKTPSPTAPRIAP